MLGNPCGATRYEHNEKNTDNEPGMFEYHVLFLLETEVIVKSQLFVSFVPCEFD